MSSSTSLEFYTQAITQTPLLHLRQRSLPAPRLRYDTRSRTRFANRLPVAQRWFCEPSEAQASDACDYAHMYNLFEKFS
jgi:hypothetical protein